MAKKFRDKLRRMNPFAHPASPADLPQPLPADPNQRLVRVYVEGYEESRCPTGATSRRARRSSWG